MIEYIKGRPALVDDETGEVLAEVHWKTPFNHDTNRESERAALTCRDKHLTRQEFKEETDINVILERYTKNGIPPEAIALNEHFGNWNDLGHFTARQRIAETNATFYLLPPKIREKFQNDPARFEQQVMEDLAEGRRENLMALGITFKEPTAPAPEPKGGQGGTPAPTPPAAPETAPKGA